MSTLGKGIGGFFATTFGGGSAAQTGTALSLLNQSYVSQLQAAMNQPTAMQIALQQSQSIQNATQIIGGSGYALSTGSIISLLRQAYYQPPKYDPMWKSEYESEREIAIAALAEKVKNG